MYTELFAIPAVVFGISFFSLAWFVVGLLAGKQLAEPPAKAPRKAARRGKKGARVELYVGNLSYNVRAKDLHRTFEACGRVLSARIIENRSSGKSKGFGFVEMAGKGDAHTAIKRLNGTELKGRKLVVNEAQSRLRD